MARQPTAAEAQVPSSLMSGVPSALTWRNSTLTLGSSSSTIAVWLLARETIVGTSWLTIAILAPSRGVGQRVVGEDRSAKVEQRDHDEQEDRNDQGELDERLAADPPAANAFGPAEATHGAVTLMLLVHTASVVEVSDWAVMMKLPFGAPSSRTTWPVNLYRLPRLCLLYTSPSPRD